MAGNIRYFQNQLPDYNGQDVSSPPPNVNDYIKAHVTAIQSNFEVSSSTCFEGVYLGVGGVAYALSDVVTKCDFLDKQSTLDTAKNYLDAALKYEEKQTDVGLKVSFLLGTAGVYASAAQYYAVTGNEVEVKKFAEMYASLSSLCAPVNQCTKQAEEILVGRAGYLCGVLFFKSKLGLSILPSETINKICSSIIESGRAYAKLCQAPCPLMYQYYSFHYLGVCHGVTGILLMLLSFPDFIKSDPSVEQDIRATVDFLLALQDAHPQKNLPPVLDESNTRPLEDTLVHWCHGAPGSLICIH
ncbi:lanC-like protein 3 isoform X2 [Antedon mediterranea]|uniref:lanC-like protein 3 isoform X2 n=1 Tax=Antedon mediterranea TaxID=105859 RepID=UPI003AF6018C